MLIGDIRLEGHEVLTPGAELDQGLTEVVLAPVWRGVVRIDDPRGGSRDGFVVYQGPPRTSAPRGRADATAWLHVWAGEGLRIF